METIVFIAIGLLVGLLFCYNAYREAKNKIVNLNSEIEELKKRIK